jgi:hypothetical protein
VQNVEKGFQFQNHRETLVDQPSIGVLPYTFRMQTLIPLLSLLVSALALGYLIKYVKATEIIARQSVEQVEATARPAIVCVNGPRLVNLGTGAAFDVDWFIPTTGEKGRIPVLRLERDLDSKAGEEAGYFHVADFQDQGTLICNYRSISGQVYSSVNVYSHRRDRFSTTFKIGKLA